MSTIAELQHRIGEINTANGWRSTEERSGKDLVNAQITRLALITTEVAEAIEEVRNGRDVDETYYSNTVAGMKPEGVPSELADVVIRAFDAADAWDIDLEAVIELKLAYNARRGFRHGGKTA